ncbi:alpha/beta fold hydrolase [Enterovirga sp. CN4-39]|uniref:alpha/beta fold hydrolase n=1 Tax=Enterovirga sp. CN4-39 TaxID=3400910 RepID=UPI003C0552F8
MFTTRRILIAAAAAASLLGVAQAQTGPAPGEGAKNVVLVHGAFADGSGWRGVYDNLTAMGYRVSIVQNPLTSLAEDVAATRRVIDRQDGPTILVGHSYGGTVITETGIHPKVTGLVYVSALAPDVHESTIDQFREFPLSPDLVIEEQSDGFAFVNGARFKTAFAGDASEADAAFMRDSQVATAMSAVKAKVSWAAWRVKPSWFVIATEDNVINPMLLRQTARRIGAVTEEIPGSHFVFHTQPKAVADVIDRAARAVGRVKR